MPGALKCVCACVCVQSNNELAVRVQQDQAEKITQLKAKRTQLKAELLQCEDT